jgi:hypothetical protein
MKVLYILGGSRTGSTIVDNVLNEVDGFFSGGEIRFLWERLDEGRLCGCRRRFEECPVWSVALERGFGLPNHPRIDVDEMVAWQRGSLRLVHMRRALRAIDSPGRTSPTLRAFADAMEQLYHAIAAVTGARVIVDSSKRASNAAMLALMPSVSPYFVHLVRDARAVAYSRRRPKLNPDRAVPSEMRVSSLLNSAGSWLGWNLTSDAIVRRQPADRVLLLRYEDFAADPVGTIGRIVRLVGEEDGSLPFVDASTVRLRGNHTVSGNPSRYVNGLVSIRKDDEWSRRMSWPQKLAVTLLTLPVLSKYGYGFRGNGSHHSS